MFKRKNNKTKTASFFALDVETANEDYSSICQIGIANFKNGKISNEWVLLVDPEEPFNPFNVEIHGITEDMVWGADTFYQLYPILKELLENQIIAHHMPYDRVAFERVAEKYDLEPIQAKWLDTARVVRRTWKQFSHKGYGLSNVSEFLKIKFRHHDALEDAKAAGLILLKAIETSGISLEEWGTRVDKPINPNHRSSDKKIKADGNPEGPFFGENLVFTGALSLPRKEAAKLAANVGCNIQTGVNKKTTLLVIGTQDKQRLKGKNKSNKQLKAESAIRSGQKLRILSEEDFLKIIEQGL